MHTQRHNIDTRDREEQELFILVFLVYKGDHRSLIFRAGEQVNRQVTMPLGCSRRCSTPPIHLSFVINNHMSKQ
jgi:hypothetical protein